MQPGREGLNECSRFVQKIDVVEDSVALDLPSGLPPREEHGVITCWGSRLRRFRYPAPSNKGFGLRAAAPIASGTFLGFYFGKLMSKAALCRQRSSKGLWKYALSVASETCGPELVIVPCQDVSADRIQPLTRQDLEGDADYCMCLINDVSRGDTLQTINVVSMPFGRAVAFFAVRNIATDEGLIMHYGEAERPERGAPCGVLPTCVRCCARAHSEPACRCSGFGLCAV